MSKSEPGRTYAFSINIKFPNFDETWEGCTTFTNNLGCSILSSNESIKLVRPQSNRNRDGKVTKVTNRKQISNSVCVIDEEDEINSDILIRFAVGYKALAIFARRSSNTIETNTPVFVLDGKKMHKLQTLSSSVNKAKFKMSKVQPVQPIQPI